MPYIGHNPTNAGSFALIDDIASTFNGSNTTFTLQVGNVNITPNAQNTVITLDGVIQHTPESYTISGSTIAFTGAPASGTDFYGILMGNSSYVENNSIGADELTVTGDGTSLQVLTSDGDGTFSWVSQSALTPSANLVTGATLKSTVTASSLTSVGSLTGLTIDASDPILTLKSDGDGNANTGYVAWQSNNGTSEGWLGYGSTGDSAFKLYLPSGNDHIEFLPNATSALTLTSSTATFAGTVIQGDLQINTPSSNISQIKHNNGSGALNLLGDQVNVKDKDGNTIASFNDGGATTFSGAVTLSSGSYSGKLSIDGDGYTTLESLGTRSVNIRSTRGINFWCDYNNIEALDLAWDTGNATFAGTVTTPGVQRTMVIDPKLYSKDNVYGTDDERITMQNDQQTIPLLPGYTITSVTIPIASNRTSFSWNWELCKHDEYATETVISSGNISSSSNTWQTMDVTDYTIENEQRVYFRISSVSTSGGTYGYMYNWRVSYTSPTTM